MEIVHARIPKTKHAVNARTRRAPPCRGVLHAYVLSELQTRSRGCDMYCRSMSFHVVPWHSMSFHVVPCRSMAFHVIPCRSACARSSEHGNRWPEYRPTDYGGIVVHRVVKPL
eukprot:7153493-Pyramimonas_sp.AAC.2